MIAKGIMQDELNERSASTGRLFNAIQKNVLSKKKGIPKDIKAEIVRKRVKATLT